MIDSMCNPTPWWRSIVFSYSDVLFMCLSINLHHADRFSAFPVEAFQRASVLISCFIGYYAPLRPLHSKSVPLRETLSLSHAASNNIARHIFIRIWENKTFYQAYVVNMESIILLWFLSTVFDEAHIVENANETSCYRIITSYP